MSIPQFIGAVIDNIVMIAGGIFFIHLAKKKQKKFLILIGILPIFFGLFQMYEKYDRFTQERVPSRSFLENKVKKQSILLENDLKLISKDGYKMLIPKGYQYTLVPTTAVSLIAINEAKASTISVSTFKVTDPLSKLIYDANNYLKGKNSTYKLKEPTVINNNGLAGRKIDFEVVKQQGVMKGYMVYYKVDHVVFQITLSSLMTQFTLSNTEFEKVIDSFTTIN